MFARLLTEVRRSSHALTSSAADRLQRHFGDAAGEGAECTRRPLAWPRAIARRHTQHRPRDAALPSHELQASCRRRARGVQRQIIVRQDAQRPTRRRTRLCCSPTTPKPTPNRSWIFADDAAYAWRGDRSTGRDAVLHAGARHARDDARNSIHAFAGEEDPAQRERQGPAAARRSCPMESSYVSVFVRRRRSGAVSGPAAAGTASPPSISTRGDDANRVSDRRDCRTTRKIMPMSIVACTRSASATAVYEGAAPCARSRMRRPCRKSSSPATRRRASTSSRARGDATARAGDEVLITGMEAPRISWHRW